MRRHNVVKKTRKQRSAPMPNPAVSPGVANPELNVQTRKILRAHYAAKYRTR